jgi:hypothetical protein
MNALANALFVSPWQSGAIRRSQSWLRPAALVSTAMLGAIGLLLVVRRTSGALTNALPFGHATIAAVVVAGIVCGGRFAWRQTDATPQQLKGQSIESILGWVGSLAVLLTGAGCAWPSAGSYTWLLWLPLVAVDQFSRRAFRRGGGRRELERRLAGSISPLAPPFKGGESKEMQRVVRLRDAAGVETILAMLRADYEPGQRHATLHVAFCPPLASLPEVDAEPVDGPDATVKVVQAFAHGARLDVRLEEPADEACFVKVELAASPASSMDSVERRR